MIAFDEAVTIGVIACAWAVVFGYAAGQRAEASNHRPFCGCKDCVAREPEERR